MISHGKKIIIFALLSNRESYRVSKHYFFEL